MGTSGTRISARVRELRFDAGSPSLNLIASVGRRPSTPVERLGDVDRLREFCVGNGVPLVDDAYTTDFLGELWTFRAAAYEVTSAVVNGRTPNADAVAVINRAALADLPVPQLALTSTGARAQDFGPLGHAGLLAYLARDVISVISGSADRLRACDAEVCGMIYLDAPSDRPRKWCSMQRCGNIAKAAKHRRVKQDPDGSASGTPHHAS